MDARYSVSASRKDWRFPDPPSIRRWIKTIAGFHAKSSPARLPGSPMTFTNLAPLASSTICCSDREYRSSQALLDHGAAALLQRLAMSDKFDPEQAFLFVRPDGLASSTAITSQYRRFMDSARQIAPDGQAPSTLGMRHNGPPTTD